MSEENVEIVRRAFAYEYYGIGGRAEAEAIFDPHVVMNPTDEAPSEGLHAIRADFERWASAWEDLKVTVEEIIHAGDQVVLVVHHQARGRKAGSRSTPASTPSIRCAGARSRAWMSLRKWQKPSKPPGCRSSALDEKRRSYMERGYLAARDAGAARLFVR